MQLPQQRLLFATGFKQAGGCDQITWEEMRWTTFRYDDLGIVCAGKAYADVREALALLGLLDTGQISQAGMFRNCWVTVSMSSKGRAPVSCR